MGVWSDYCCRAIADVCVCVLTSHLLRTWTFSAHAREAGFDFCCRYLTGFDFAVGGSDWQLLPSVFEWSWVLAERNCILLPSVFDRCLTTVGD